MYHWDQIHSAWSGQSIPYDEFQMESSQVGSNIYDIIEQRLDILERNFASRELVGMNSYSSFNHTDLNHALQEANKVRDSINRICIPCYNCGLYDHVINDCPLILRETNCHNYYPNPMMHNLSCSENQNFERGAQYELNAYNSYPTQHYTTCQFEDHYESPPMNELSHNHYSDTQTINFENQFTHVGDLHNTSMKSKFHSMEKQLQICVDTMTASMHSLEGEVNKLAHAIERKYILSLDECDSFNSYPIPQHNSCSNFHTQFEDSAQIDTLTSFSSNTIIDSHDDFSIEQDGPFQTVFQPITELEDKLCNLYEPRAIIFEGENSQVHSNNIDLIQDNFHITNLRFDDEVDNHVELNPNSPLSQSEELKDSNKHVVVPKIVNEHVIAHVEPLVVDFLKMTQELLYETSYSMHRNILNLLDPTSHDSILYSFAKGHKKCCDGRTMTVLAPRGVLFPFQVH